MAGTMLRILLVEDNPGDARLLKEKLREVGAEVGLAHVEHLRGATLRLGEESFDVLLLDLDLPDSRGLDTLDRVLGLESHPAVVILTGMDDESLGVQAVQKGAQDYLVKGQQEGRSLLRALRYAVERKALQGERDRLIAELREALGRVKSLSGLLPICAWCKRIRDDQGYWKQFELYIHEHSDADFTHGICPECARKLRPNADAGTEGS